MKKIILFFVVFAALASLCAWAFLALVPVKPLRSVAPASSNAPRSPQRDDPSVLPDPVGSSSVPVTLYLSINANGSQSCAFGDLSGCRLFSLPLQSEQGSVTPVLSDLAEILPDVSAVLPTVSPDGTRIAFRAGNTTKDVTEFGVFGYDLLREEVFPVSEQFTHNAQAHWPFWLTNTELLASNANDCSASSTGCSKSSLYEDIVRFVFSDDLVTVTEADILLGGSTSSLGVDTSACSFANPVVDPTNPSRIAFHSSPVDGSGTVQSGDCPFVTGRGGEKLTSLAQPVPVIMNLDRVVKNTSAKEFVAGEEYYPVDLQSAGISGCAHGSFDAQGIYTCIEQGSLTRDTLCADSRIPLASCVKSGSSLIQRNKLYSFALDEDAGIYRSVRPGTSAFAHAHPEDLPEFERYWTSAEPCQLYSTKYAQSCGDDTLVANVQCIVPTPSERSGYTTAFSRIMLIDVKNRENPLYTDVTGLLEDAYPDQWSSGTASGFSATCK